jgi:hypothetical protein
MEDNASSSDRATEETETIEITDDTPIDEIINNIENATLNKKRNK